MSSEVQLKISKSSKKIPKELKAPSIKLPWPRFSEPDIETGLRVPVGVDLKEKRNDVIKIVHKFFKVEGVSMEDLLQEVFVAIAHKNHTPSAHNPKKSSFGHYVYMVANNVCINLVHKSKRYDKERESIDSPNGHEDSRSILDTFHSEKDSSESIVNDFMTIFESKMRREGKWDTARYIRAVRSGASMNVVREALTFGSRKISSKTIRDIRNYLKNSIDSYYSSL